MRSDLKATLLNMEFRKYQHLERYGTDEVEGIEIGTTYVFPKIDGTNGSIWLSDGEIQAGSRRRHLSLESDNHGFYAWAIRQDNIKKYLLANPTHRLFGEWLVPHSLKTYREDALRKFYVFDVSEDKSPSQVKHEGDSLITYMPYNYYAPGLEEFGIDFIIPLAVVENGTEKQFTNQLARNVFLIEDGQGVGEGIVIKNYSFVNKYGRQTWAKIVTNEFKEKHSRSFGPTALKGAKIVELEIAREYVTKSLCEKVHAKIINDTGSWSSKMIPRLLSSVYHDVITEESWHMIKKFKNPTIDFGLLQRHVYARVKEKMTNVF